ncbi:unnamed protein product [Protopolystoma xenopodis]|uniref:Uncharacterized protein n=1 Tax=Protopolystoma xenopodis TaxID=117903 RepID=A0A3S4ZXI6_9PLAT|nr:unnamed protein product [Protopolystoma xenopodis]
MQVCRTRLSLASSSEGKIFFPLSRQPSRDRLWVIMTAGALRLRDQKKGSLTTVTWPLSRQNYRPLESSTWPLAVSQDATTDHFVTDLTHIFPSKRIFAQCHLPIYAYFAWPGQLNNSTFPIRSLARLLSVRAKTNSQRLTEFPKFPAPGSQDLEGLGPARGGSESSKLSDRPRGSKNMNASALLAVR